MVILILQRKDPEERITYGASMGRIGIWRYLRRRFPESERLFIEQGPAQKDSVLKRFFSGFVNLYRIISRLITSRNKWVLLSYPDFPYCTPLNATSFFKALVFMILIKCIFTIKQGKIITYFHDLPRFEKGSVFYSGHRLNHAQTKLIEFLIAHMSSHIWASSGPIKSFLVSDLLLRPERVQTVVFGNVRAEVSLSEPHKDNRVKFLYCGLLDNAKGVDGMVKAFMDAHIKGAELILCGPSHNWALAPEYSAHGINHVGLPASEAETRRLAAACDIGIIPHPRHPYNDMIFPSKLSFYITSELPILAVNTTETSRIVEENEIGISCSPGQMPDKMRLLAGDRKLRQRYKINCRRIKDRYFWDSLLARAFETILRPDTSGV